MDEKLIEARLLLEAQLSHGEIHGKLRDALKAQHPGYWCWMAEVYDDAVIYELSMKNAEEARSRYFRCSYSLGENDGLTLGIDAVEVTKKVTWEPVASAPLAAAEADDVTISGDFVPLLERAVRADGTVPIKIIAPGQGSSGFYPAEVLERDGPGVFKAGTKMYVDHPTPTEEAERPERSLRDLAAELVTDARYESAGVAGPGLYADAKVFDPWKPFVEELAPHIGVSINAMGKYRVGEVAGQKTPIIDAIVAAKSVDFVTTPGAGGQILSIFEAARSRATQPQSGGIDVNEAQLREAEAARDAALAEAEQLKADNATLLAENGRLREREVLAEATRLAGEIVAGVEGLHEITRARLVKEAVAGLQVKDGALDVDALKASAQALVDAAVAEYAAITESGQVKGMGGAPAGGLRVDLAECFKAIGLNDEQAALAAKGR